MLRTPVSMYGQNYVLEITSARIVLGVKHKSLITMKSTKIMLAVIATFFITWCVMGLIGYLLSDASYKECMIDGATLFLLVTIGWVPCLIVGIDLDSNLE